MKQDKLCLDLENGLDVKASKKEVQKKVEEETGVKETSSEDVFYRDNCVPDDEGVCRRKRWSAEDDKEWLNKSKKRKEREEYEMNLKIKRAPYEIYDGQLD